MKTDRLLSMDFLGEKSPIICECRKVGFYTALFNYGWRQWWVRKT